ncbi:hypothetical protein Syun_022048 [Stephania yunnanensis]|uniref:NADH dehydrogenase-like complex L n=1 Tax=Stephania yunnanensis TaxID=152371 RepID=A0AAP0IGS9_9MAGN
MTCSFSLPSARVLPSLFHSRRGAPSLSANSKHSKQISSSRSAKKQLHGDLSAKPPNHKWIKKTDLAVQIGVLLAAVEQPAMAVTGVNNEEDLTWVLTQWAIVAFFYFLVMPPVILNWLRLRWYKRGFFEMYFQFMFVFIFFPGILLWAPFVNFRRLPRDPNMKYPWSTPQDSSFTDSTSSK